LGKNVEKSWGDFFLTHTVYTRHTHDAQQANKWTRHCNSTYQARHDASELTFRLHWWLVCVKHSA